MNTYLDKIRQTIKYHDLVHIGDSIVVGLSGGVDSVALLGLLLELKESYDLKIHPIYVHHNMRVEADLDVTFCKEFCSQLGLDCEVVYVDVPELVKVSKKSEEEVARNLRYEALRAYKKQCNGTLIAIAHHKEDQAETIIHRLIRGAGSQGLKGMSYRNNDIIRPLLDFTKNELIDFVKIKGYKHVIDESNVNTKYTRNKIRHELIPYLEKEFNPNLVNSLVRLSDILSEDEIYMENQARLCCEKCISNVHTLDISLLEGESLAIKRRVIRQYILGFKGNLKNIEFAHVDRVLQLLKQQSGKQVTLCEDIIIIKEFNHLKLMKESSVDKSLQGFAINLDTVPIKGYIQEANIGFSIRQIEQVEYKELINYKDSFKISKNVYTKWFDYDKIKANLVLRSRQSGDFIRIHKDGGSKTMKKVFVDQKVPGTERSSIPLLADGNEIIWAVGLRDNPIYAVTVESKNIIEVELSKEDNHGKY